jgi:hypothetical protein
MVASWTSHRYVTLAIAVAQLTRSKLHLSHCSDTVFLFLWPSTRVAHAAQFACLVMGRGRKRCKPREPESDSSSVVSALDDNDTMEQLQAEAAIRARRMLPSTPAATGDVKQAPCSAVCDATGPRAVADPSLAPCAFMSAVGAARYAIAIHMVNMSKWSMSHSLWIEALAAFVIHLQNRYGYVDYSLLLWAPSAWICQLFQSILQPRCRMATSLFSLKFLPSQTWETFLTFGQPSMRRTCLNS